MKAKPVAIYALYDKNGVRYIGQSRNMERRLLGHRYGRHKKILSKCKVRVLRYTTKRQALKIEAQVIAAYYKRGECDLNTNCTSDPLICIETNRFFPTLKAAALFFDCGSGTVRKRIGKIGWFWRNYEDYDRFSLIRYRRDYVWSHYEI